MAPQNLRMHRVRTLSAILALAVLTATGCGGGNGLEMYPVRGEVTYKGKPLERGIVDYLPTAPDAGRPASGSIQPDGTFVLTTHARDDGAVKGTYSIVIHSYEERADAPKTREEIEAQGSRVPQWKSVIPEKYTTPETSGLTDTVDENHSGFKKIELSD